MHQFIHIRRILFSLLFLSVLLTAYSIYYKVKYWNFSLAPNASTDIFIVDAHISFEAFGGPVKVSFATPKNDSNFKILNEEVSAKGYAFKKTDVDGRAVFKAKNKIGKQNIYYRLTLYDNEESRGKVREKSVTRLQKPLYDEQQMQIAEAIFEAAEKLEGNTAQQIILIFNEQPLNESVSALLPVKVNLRQKAALIIDLLALKNMPARLVRGVFLQEGKKASLADIMLEVYEGNRWRLYDLKTAEEGMPKNFVPFQRGDVSLLDVEGGENSSVRFSVLKSVTSSFKLAEHRSRLTSTDKLFSFSVYSLPLLEQNILKWLMVFPLGILVVVLMRNIVGVPTMGTFTPMLVAMSLVQTGFWAGLACFSIIVSVGLLLRTLLSKLNLLLVPRISAVVIFVILIIEAMAIIGYQFDLKISSSAVFFPIIITAWVIERASVSWEEEGAKNALTEIFYTLLTAVLTYAVIASEYIRHFTFAFNEINLVILFVVMLLGTYTGYRITELKRFYPLIKGKKNV